MSDRGEARRWLETWQAAGAALHEQRLARLAELTDEEARRAMLEVFALWRPPQTDSEGAELVEQQRWFALAARQ